METDYINEREGLKVELRREEGAESPRKAGDCLGVFVGLPHPRRQWGDEQVQSEAALDARGAETEAAGGDIYPVYCYEHGGVALALDDRRFKAWDHWDTSRVGSILVAPADIEKLGTPPERAESVVRAELAEYEAWLNNNVWVAHRLAGSRDAANGGWSWTHDETFGPHYGPDPEKSSILQDAGIPAGEAAAEQGWTWTEA